MKDTEELRLLALAPNELRLLLALRHLEDRWHEVDASMEELEELTSYSRSSLSRALKGLQASGYVQTTRKKRNFGMLHRNKYYLPPRVTHDTSDLENTADGCVTGATSTTNSNIDSNLVTITKPNNLDIKAINTTCLLAAAGSEEEKPSMVNKWSDDDDIGAFGLLGNESDAGDKSKPLSKRDPKTRHQRPQDEWTAADVASEFSFRVYSKIKGIPGIVNTNNLRGALSANRNRFGINATIEMEVLERFFGDERNIIQIRKHPSSALGMFLKAITNNAGEVITDLGMDEDIEPEAPVQNLVYASDGKAFDNSMPGRASLARYEEKLRKG